MELEDANNPAPEQELASEDLSTTEAVTDEAPEGEDPDDGTLTQEEIEQIEVERNGKRYKIPKELESELMMQADYTRKTQEAAELRKQAQAEREAVHRERQLYEELSEDFATVKWIDNRLHQLQQLDIRTLAPEQQTQYLIELNRLQLEKQNRNGQIEAKKSELTAQQEQYSAHTLRQAISELQRPDDKFGWNGKFDKSVSEDLTKFALDMGFSHDEVRNTNHPVMIKLLHLGKIGKAALDKQRTTPARPPAQPAAKVPTAKAQGTTDPNKMSVSQMSKLLKSTGVL